jgi:XTP/dITP diphosphohydrolase
MTVKMKLYVATGNAHKLKEISQILPGFEIVAENPGDVEENAPDFAGNALIKVRAIAGSRRGEWCMADDSGLEVEALGGEPGVRSARYAGGHGDTAANNELLLRNLEGVDNRAARFVCSIALVSPDGREFSVEGSCRGRIIESAAGAQGFGYDPLFVPEGYEQTFAELSSEEKNALSHRGRALAAARKVLKDNA